METCTRNGGACPLRHQTGAQAIHDFDSIVASWPLDARVDFERERAARAMELAQIIAGQTESRQQSAWLSQTGDAI